MKGKLSSTIILICAIVSFIINLVLYSRLPEKVAMQMSLSGGLNNFVPKIIFVMAAPLVLFIDYFYIIKSEEQGKYQSLIIGIIIFVVHIFLLYLNLK